MTDPEKPTTGVVDPDTGKPHPNSGPSGGPEGSDAGTQAQDVAREAGDDADAGADGETEKHIGTHNTEDETPPAW